MSVEDKPISCDWAEAGPGLRLAERSRALERRWPRAVEWLRVAGTVGTTQVIAQGLGFATGLLMVRILPPEQFTLYTLAWAMVGTFNVLADSGVANGVMAQAGAVWHDRVRLGAVIKTGLNLRRRFTLVASLLACPALGWLLRRHGADWASVAAVLAGVLAIYALALGGDLYAVAPKLHQNVRGIQMVNVVAALAKLAAAIVLVTWVPLAAVAVGTAAVVQVWANRRLRLLCARYADLSQAEDPVIRAAVWPVVWRALPGAIYYSMMGQLSVWLLSVFGSGTGIAEIGALGRIGQVLTIAGYFLGIAVEPRFARLRHEPRLLRRRFLQVHGALLLAAGTAVAVTALFPGTVLQLLGPHYRALDREVVLQVACSCAAAIAGAAVTLPAARGWIMHPAVSLPLLLGVQTALVLVLPRDTVMGVLSMTLLFQLFQWLLFGGYALWRCGRQPESPEPSPGLV